MVVTQDTVLCTFLENIHPIFSSRYVIVSSLKYHPATRSKKPHAGSPGGPLGSRPSMGPLKMKRDYHPLCCATSSCRCEAALQDAPPYSPWIPLPMQSCDPVPGTSLRSRGETRDRSTAGSEGSLHQYAQRHILLGLIASGGTQIQKG